MKKTQKDEENVQKEEDNEYKLERLRGKRNTQNLEAEREYQEDTICTAVKRDLIETIYSAERERHISRKSELRALSGRQKKNSQNFMKFKYVTVKNK